VVDEPTEPRQPQDSSVEDASPLARTSLSSLDHAGVAYRVRKSPEPSGFADVKEIDIWLARSSQEAADAALASAGLHLFEAPGHRDHRFYLGFDGRQWLKIDAKFEHPGPPRWRRSAESALAALGRARPVAIRRLGPVVAVLGPDGAGKGSVVDALQLEIPLGVTTVYHGHKVRRGPGSRRAKSRPPRRPAGSFRECAFVLRQHLRGLRAMTATYAAAWRGDIVLCDRHPIEVLAVRPQRPPLAASLERLLVRTLTPWPDAIVVLDAPAQTLFERKGEHRVEVLERWRRGYRSAFGSRANVVSTVGPLDASVAEVSAVIWEALAARRRWARAS
jgi:thymidylate kinase